MYKRSNLVEPPPEENATECDISIANYWPEYGPAPSHHIASTLLCSPCRFLSLHHSTPLRTIIIKWESLFIIIIVLHYALLLLVAHPQFFTEYAW